MPISDISVSGSRSLTYYYECTIFSVVFTCVTAYLCALLHMCAITRRRRRKLFDDNSHSFFAVNFHHITKNNICIKKKIWNHLNAAFTIFSLCVQQIVFFFLRDLFQFFSNLFNCFTRRLLMIMGADGVLVKESFLLVCAYLIVTFSLTKRRICLALAVFFLLIFIVCVDHRIFKLL